MASKSVAAEGPSTACIDSESRSCPSHHAVVLMFSLSFPS